VKGYLTLDSIPSGRKCRPLFIPDDSMWLALFGGALTELQKAYNYEQFGTLTPEEMAAACEDIINQWYAGVCSDCELPDGQPVTRLDADGNWQTLSNGEWVEPTGAYTVPPLPPIDAPTDAERRCLAALNAELVLHQLYEEWTDAWQAELSLFDAIITAAEFLTTRVGVWLGLLSGGQALIVFAIAEVFYNAMASITADYWDTDFSEKMKCLLLYHAGNVGDTVVFDFVAFREDLALQTNWLDPTFADMRLMIQINYMLQFIGAQGLNAAGATTSITDCTLVCGCEECGTPITPTGAHWSQAACTSCEGDFLAFDGEGMYSTLTAFNQGSYADLYSYVSPGTFGWCVCVNFDTSVTEVGYAEAMENDCHVGVCYYGYVNSGAGSGETFLVPADHPMLVVAWAAAFGGHVTSITVDPI